MAKVSEEAHAEEDPLVQAEVGGGVSYLSLSDLYPHFLGETALGIRTGFVFTAVKMLNTAGNAILRSISGSSDALPDVCEPNPPLNSSDKPQ